MRLYILSILFVSCFSMLVSAQSINTTFGKNRVQYNDDFNKWDKYETENFITYWYGKSRNVGQATVQIAELDHDEIQKILEHRLNKKIEIVVYTDLSDVKQTNIGNEDSFHSKTGETKIIGNKIFVFFDGDHQNLRTQIRKGIASVYLNSILFGSNLQEQVQNAILLRLPEWFKQGLISFSGSTWDYKVEDELRDIIHSNPKRYLEFDKIIQDYPEIGGHSMWYYLEQMYGMANIANLVYLTRINRKLDESFYYILGVPFEQIKEEWSIFYKNGFDIEELVKKKKPVIPTNALPIKNKRNLPCSIIELSPDGSQFVFVLNDRGKQLVYLYNLESNTYERIDKFGTKNIFQETDFNYPLVTWHPSGRFVTLVYEHKDIIYIKELDISDGQYKETNFPENFHRIYNIDYIDSENYLINASVDGFSDLFTFKIKSRSNKRLTEDFYDDLDARVYTHNGRKGVLFASNRPNTELKKQKLDTILPLGNMDIFFLPLIDGDKGELEQITDTPNKSERDILKIGKEKYLYLSNENGIKQRFVLTGDEHLANSKYIRNIKQHSYHKKSNTYIYSQSLDTRNYILIDQIDFGFEAGGNKSSFLEGQEDDVKPMIFLEEEEQILPGYEFQSPFEDPENIESINEESTTTDPSLEAGFEKYFSNYFSEAVQDGKRVIKFSPMRASASRLQFRWFDLTTKLDNQVLFEGLESYTENEQEITAQPLGILFKTDIKDIFEDYKIEAGIRIPTSFNGSEVFAVYDNDKKLFDHRYGIYRKTETVVQDATSLPIQRFRKNALLGLYRIKYPFDVYRSLSLTSSLRFDKFFFISSEINSLSSPQEREKRLSLKLEYIFDNSFDVGLNIKNGLRYKVFLEAINEFDLQVTDGFEFSLSNGFTSILGFDARYYQPILRHAVLAIRGTGAASFGNKKMLYFLGGMEGALGSRFEENIPIPGNDFSYKALAPHLRGFDHNIRNGSNYLLSNIELRLPLMKLLGIQKTRFSFLRDLQFVGFFDAGMAWHGRSPFDANNPINQATLESPPVIVIDIKYFRDPLVMGYGFGMRSTLLGYFVKVDYAYGIETRAIQDPKLYLSVGKDF